MVFERSHQCSSDNRRAGAIGKAIAAHLINAGHEVILANRRGQPAWTKVIANLGPLASRARWHRRLPPTWCSWPSCGRTSRPHYTDCLTGADVSWSTPPTSSILSTVSSSPSTRSKPFGIATGSQVVASLAPGAKVIKAFNTLYVAYIAPDPRHDAGRQVLFFAGDDPTAKESFASVFDQVGFAPVDVGTLREGGPLMQAPTGPLSALHVLKQD